MLSPIPLFCLGLFVALLLGLEVGRFIGTRFRSESTGDGLTGASEGVVFAVLGLLLAFTFTASAARFVERQHMIVDQANALSTAWLRLDVLDTEDTRSIREGMIEWTRLALFHADPATDPAERERLIARGAAIQLDAWRRTVDAVERDGRPSLSAFVLAPQNDWIDLSTSRYAAHTSGLPPLVMPTLVVLAICSAVLAGVSMSRKPTRNLTHMLAFALTISLAIYVTLDLGQTRSGLIRIDHIDRTLEIMLADFERDLAAEAVQPADTP
ncbi:MAG: hypothetical protein AAF916_09755 [Planctomycetota bacterium]